jgi:NDP-sugar pyrophosphorylase family protein
MALKEGKGKPIISSSSVTEGSQIEGPSFIDGGSSLIDCQIYSSYICERTVLRRSSVENSLIMSDCIIEGAKILNSILAEGCKVENGAIIEESVLGDGVTIREDTVIRGKVGKAHL